MKHNARSYSFVLPSWRRQKHVLRIVEHAARQPFVSEIIVAQDGEYQPPVLPLGIQREGGLVPVRVLWLARRLQMWTRYVGAMAAVNRWILTCDDDVIVSNWMTIALAFFRDPSRVVAAMPQGHQRHFKELQGSHEVLLGWGAAFDRDLVLPAFRRYVDQRGVDDLLLSKADRIFTAMVDSPPLVIDAEYEQLPTATDPETARYLESSHWREVAEARRAVECVLRHGGTKAKVERG